mmetsp:Transcript_10147/g.18907  ORF Transcript_10147/g.18907 Transcript_10147/m.18907 type:complete len:622 (-) Transcript_10147:20-1885(-)
MASLVFLLSLAALARAQVVNRSSNLRKQSVEVTSQGVSCGGIDLSANAGCKQVVEWAAGGGKWDTKADAWFQQLPSIAGVSAEQANLQDFQRLYFCAPPGDSFCRMPPCTGCTNPPCNDCFAGNQIYASVRPGCDGNDKGVGCVPPKTAMGYKGQTWPTTVIHGTQEMHIFAIGDWGGMDGSLDTAEGRPTIVAYDWGRRPGPSVFPRSRWNKMHTVEYCGHKKLVECFNTRGQPPCDPACGYVAGVDDQPQMLVANAFKARAALKDPQYILNVGDNFYWGGIEKTCGTPMNQIAYPTKHQFDQIFEGVYQGAGLSNKPWFSVLGNHDWGGREMDAAWDQQIAYTWASKRWILPAPYWMQKVDYVDQGFSVEIFLIDSNIEDADEDVNANPEHNICGAMHNPPGSSCAKVGGPSSIHECHDWFQKLWDDGAAWATEKLKKSDSQWQIMVTHFPCGHKVKYYKELHLKYGLDLLVTGHTHYQMMYWSPEKLGGLKCFITGGGGGITSENNVEPENDNDHQYGFFDLSMSKDEIKIESVNWKGNVIDTETVEPYDGTDTKKAELAPCEVPQPGSACFKVIKWAMQDGIHSNPDWFPGLTSSSPMSKFQEKFYREHKDGCGKPC